MTRRRKLSKANIKKLIDWPAWAEDVIDGHCREMIRVLNRGEEGLHLIMDEDGNPILRVCAEAGTVEDLRTEEIVLFNGSVYKALAARHKGFIQGDLFGNHRFVPVAMVDDMSDIPF
jgi:hypothetical protein